MIKELRSLTILGADFIAKTELVLELGSGRCNFTFAPSVYFNFINTTPIHLLSKLIHCLLIYLTCRWGIFHPDKKKKLERLIYQCPDVLNETLGLTHIMEYELQLMDNTPVRINP